MKLLLQPSRPFSVISNLRTPLQQTFAGKFIQYDDHIDRYRPSTQAYLKKRRLTKQQIWPKILITPNRVESMKADLEQQLPIKRELTEEAIVRLYDSQQLTSNYLVSRFSQKHLRQLINEYMKKVIICGRTPPISDTEVYRKQKQEVIRLYRTFFYGEEPSPLQKELEIRYLSEKQEKNFRQQQQPNNSMHKCKWTQSNQRTIQQYKNWQARPINEFDDFRPLFYPIDVRQKLPVVHLMNKLDRLSWWDNVKFKYLTQPTFVWKSKAHIDWILSFNLLRMMHWCNCMEFQRLLRIPPDFQIELAVLHFHGWLLMDFARRIGGSIGTYMARKLQHNLRGVVVERIGKLNIKKKQDFQKNVSQVLRLNLNVFDYHFNKSPVTKENPYVKIDGLIWSTMFLEKVDRYSEEVYLFSEYAVKSYQMMKKMTEEQFMTCMVEFDAYIGDYDCRQKIRELNPPLTDKEYQAELASDRKDKRYYYSYGTNDVVMPLLDPKADVQKEQVVKNNFMYRLTRLFKKYYSLDTFDYYNEVDKQEKERKKQKKSGWQTDQQKLQQIQKQFDRIDQIRRSIKK